MPEYLELRKAIISPEHLVAFQSSLAHATVLEYITKLNSSIVGLKLSTSLDLSSDISAIISIINYVEGLVHDIPPVDNSNSRFGNPAFRTFYDRVSELAPSLNGQLPIPQESVVELAGYFSECWGNRTRIDYGSGMELNFLCWLICLEKLGVWSLENTKDCQSIVLKVFWRYVEIMRLLQSTYWLEPAGSHGVWGLDDYHFLPFLWGSGQLLGHKYIKPKAIHDAEVVEEYAKDYMYFACIQFINSIKTASLRWHSPMLDDISAVKTWDKVNGGLIKMYKAEVLGKLPVAQHFLFGSMLPVPKGLPPSTLANDLPNANPTFVSNPMLRNADPSCGHVHASTGWTQDCCGIPVPSAFGAAAEQQRKEGQRLQGLQNVRIIPFD
ncbi:Phosphotyrosyl phosphatase activator [Fistulina hepatica ATCC 64428]|uniref:Serine/threonine-protein phosphatase 2A activator n=1 Tax=Fistulina hepatica ATCC 64428 TaxID=1128425 RepID=A0A0D7ALB6_9AGAR|nr:Phosphotyrosyl phosphatase activator [Fistulina hepatica ATCC 64428]